LPSTLHSKINDNDILMDKHPDCRFVYKRSDENRAIALIALVVIGMQFLLGRPAFTLPSPLLSWANILTLLPLILGLTGLLLLLWMLRKNPTISIDAAGIAFHGPFSRYTPAFIAWQDLAQIRLLPSQSPTSSARQILVFIPKRIPAFFFYFQQRGKELFRPVEKETTATLRTAVEHYWGALEPLQSSEKTGIPFLPLTSEIGKEAERTVYIALGLVCVAMVLMTIPAEYVLDAPARTWWLGSGALAGATVTAVYLRKVTPILHKALPTLLIAGLSAWIMLPLTALLPRWLGEHSEETFVLTEETATRQLWRSVAAPELQVILHAPSCHWRYEDVGTRQELQVYRGPVGLNTLARDAYRSLQQPRRQE